MHLTFFPFPSRSWRCSCPLACSVIHCCAPSPHSFIQPDLPLWGSTQCLSQRSKMLCRYFIPVAQKITPLAYKEARENHRTDLILPVMAGFTVGYCPEREESTFITLFRHYLHFLNLCYQKLFATHIFAEKHGTTEHSAKLSTLCKRSKNFVFLLRRALEHSDSYLLLVMLYSEWWPCQLEQQSCPKCQSSLEACSYISLWAESRIFLLDGFDMALIFTNHSL